MTYTPADLKPYFPASDPQSIDLDTIVDAAAAVFGGTVQYKDKKYVRLTVDGEATIITDTSSGFAFGGSSGLFRDVTRSDDMDDYVWQLSLGLLETLGILDPEF